MGVLTILLTSITQEFWVNTAISAVFLIGVLGFFLKRFFLLIDRLEQTVNGLTRALESIKGENKRLYDAQNTNFKEHDRRIRMLENKVMAYDEKIVNFYKDYPSQVREIALRVVKEFDKKE